MTWSVWLEEGRIERHRPERAELAVLRKAAERALGDAAVPGLSPEGRFQRAYLAALEFAAIVVLAPGYHVKSRLGHHQLTFEAAGLVLGAEAAGIVTYFDRCRRKRNVISHDGDEVAPELANELLHETRWFAEFVDSWLVQGEEE